MQTAKAKKPTKTRLAKSSGDLNFANLLEKIDDGKTILRLRRDEKVFTQGDRGEAVYFIEAGKVKVTVMSVGGKEVVLAILGPSGFVGEGCLAGQTLRVSSATAVHSSRLFRIERPAMLRALHSHPELSAKFTASLLARMIDLQEDLCDQLFNHSENRLARILLKHARGGSHAPQPAAQMSQLSHEMLAEMLGIARSEVTHLMKKFRRLGLIDYDVAFPELITVRTELLMDVVLSD